MEQQAGIKRSNLSFYLGGKALFDPEQWILNIDMVRATVKYIIATGRLNIELESNTAQS
jgi:hypothetical protein